MARRSSRPSPRTSSYDASPYGEGGYRGGSSSGSGGRGGGGGGGGGGSAFNTTTLAILGGVFLLGIGVGIGVSSNVTTNSDSIASKEGLDLQVKDPEICLQNGSSAIVTDMRLFVTLSPFNVFVAQPSIQPGCVLRSSNWAILEQRGLLKGDDVRKCRQRLNTFAFVGALNDKPEVDCVYQNNSAKNLFRKPNSEGIAPEAERF